jgi:hypothetical protein
MDLRLIRDARASANSPNTNTMMATDTDSRTTALLSGKEETGRYCRVNRG